MSKAKARDAALWVVATFVCVGFFLLHRNYVEQTGRLPGEVQTFHPSGGSVQHVPPGEDWYDQLAYPPATNIHVVGPRGPDGKVIPRWYYARDGTIETYTDDHGAVKWRTRTPGPRVGPPPYEPNYTRSLTEEVEAIKKLLKEGQP